MASCTTVFVFAIAAFVAHGTDGLQVNVPPGYRLVPLSNQPTGRSRLVAINNNSEIVWSTGSSVFDATTYEIYRYKDGEITQISNNRVYDDRADINDQGWIVWTSWIGPDGAGEIALFRDGQTIYLTDESAELVPGDNFGPAINNIGHVAWTRAVPDACGEFVSEIWFWDGAVKRQISNLGLTSQQPSINDADQISFTAYNFCNGDVRRLALYSDGEVSFLSDGQFPAGASGILPSGAIYWGAHYVVSQESSIMRFDGQASTLFLDPGEGPSVSADGRIGYYFWDEATQTWQVRCYHDGIVSQLTTGPLWSFDADINSKGEVAWEYGLLPNSRTIAILRQPAGDMNCDSIVSVADVPAFVTALVAPGSYADQFPNCDRSLADTNTDGFVGMGDIGEFVRLLMP